MTDAELRQIKESWGKLVALQEVTDSKNGEVAEFARRHLPALIHHVECLRKFVRTVKVGGTKLTAPAAFSLDSSD